MKKTKRTKAKTTKRTEPQSPDAQILRALKEKVGADQPFTHDHLYGWLENDTIERLIRDGYLENVDDGRIRLTAKGMAHQEPVLDTPED